MAIVGAEACLVSCLIALIGLDQRETLGKLGWSSCGINVRELAAGKRAAPRKMKFI